MAFTQQDLDDLEEVMASGERRVKFADKETEYQATSQLMLARQQIKAVLAGGKKRNRSVRLFGSTN